MPDTQKLTSNLHVSPFIRPEDLGCIAPQFHTLINNRPDGEDPGQPSSAEIERAARQLGMDYMHLPIVPGQVSEQQVLAFAQAIADRKGPVLAFCRTGTRSTTLWALSQAGKRSADEILATAKHAGYDLSALRPKLEDRAAQS